MLKLPLLALAAFALQSTLQVSVASADSRFQCDPSVVQMLKTGPADVKTAVVAEIKTETQALLLSAQKMALEGLNLVQSGRPVPAAKAEAYRSLLTDIQRQKTALEPCMIAAQELEEAAQK